MSAGLHWVAVICFLVNGLLLAGTLNLTGGRVQPVRLLAASAIGAVFAVWCLVPGFGFLGQLHWHLIQLILMAALAFGADRDARKRWGIFVLLELAAEGLALLAGKPGSEPVLLCALCVRLLSGYALRGRLNRRLLPVEIRYLDRCIRLTALADTGNELRDPITGERVTVVGEQCAMELTGLTDEELRHPLETMAADRIPGLRLIPYRCVGMEQGMLLAMRLPNVRIGSREGTEVVAFAPTELGSGTYQALTGGV